MSSAVAGARPLPPPPPPPATTTTVAAKVVRTAAPPGATAAQMVTIPSAGRPTLRRSAKDPRAGLSAYLVADDAGAHRNISVALRCADRLVGVTLRGHRAPVVDMEFISELPAPAAAAAAAAAAVKAASPSSPTMDAPSPPRESSSSSSSFSKATNVFTLGSCDRDGVVFLWFLQVVKNNLNIETGMRVLRKYSFYSLRKTKDAHYARIRLAGNHRRGHMILVPNDGSNVRVIGFRCDVDPTSGTAVPVIEAPPVRPALPAPPVRSATSGGDTGGPAHPAHQLHAKTVAAGAAGAVGVAGAAAAHHRENAPYHDNPALDDHHDRQHHDRRDADKGDEDDEEDSYEEDEEEDEDEDDYDEEDGEEYDGHGDHDDRELVHGREEQIRDHDPVLYTIPANAKHSPHHDGKGHKDAGRGENDYRDEDYDDDHHNVGHGDRNPMHVGEHSSGLGPGHHAARDHRDPSDPDDYGADERVDDHDEYVEFKDALGPRAYP